MSPFVLIFGLMHTVMQSVTLWLKRAQLDYSNQTYIMICVACQVSKRNTGGLMMASRGICVPPHGGALKNANAFVLADVIMSVDTSR